MEWQESRSVPSRPPVFSVAFPALAALSLASAVPACAPPSHANDAPAAPPAHAAQDVTTGTAVPVSSADAASASPVSSGGSLACAALGESAPSRYRVRYDQVGYAPDAERSAVVLSPGLPAPHYRIHDAVTHCVVAEGNAGPRVLETTSRAATPLTGDRIDLSALGTGRYVLVLADGSQAGPIVVAKDAYAPLLPLVSRFLAEQRCGPTTKSASIHDACHLFRSTEDPHAHSGDGVVVDEGARPPYHTTKRIDVEGGWHDAGDYIKFTGTTSYALAVELMALRDHGAVLGAPGRELADELRWGLDWLLKMLTGPEPYHQVGGEGDHDPDWRSPEGDTAKPIAAYDQRPVFRFGKGRGRNIFGRSAAAFAFGSQVYAADAPYAQKLLAAARATYALAKSNPATQSPDPREFYAEKIGEDDLVLAAAALARITGEAGYLADAYAFGARLTPAPGTTVGWNSVDAIALLEAARAFPAGSHERADLSRALAILAAPIAATATTPVGPGGPFGYALPSFGNGTIAESLGAAATCLAAWRLNGTPGCDAVARRQIHWMLGENPFGLSFLVGAGTESPKNVHHSFGQAAHVAIPGTIPGGPTARSVLAGSKLKLPPKTDPYAPWSTDDLLYEDRVEDYVCNEPAIDFPAALVFALGELGEGR